MTASVATRIGDNRAHDPPAAADPGLDLALPARTARTPAPALHGGGAGGRRSAAAGEAPAALAQRLALAKARAVAELHPQAVVIGSDQWRTSTATLWASPAAMNAR